jgi:hypothetical protein
MRYQHAIQERDRVIAAALSDLIVGNVTPNAATKQKKRKRVVST